MDTFGPAVESSDIDGCNHLGTEEGIEDAVFYGRSECDSFAAEGFGDFDRAAEEADVTALLHAAHDVARGVLERCDGLGIVASAGMIAAGRQTGSRDRGARLCYEKGKGVCRPISFPKGVNEMVSAQV